MKLLLNHEIPLRATEDGNFIYRVSTPQGPPAGPGHFTTESKSPSAGGNLHISGTI